MKEIEKKINIENVKCIKTITEHTKPVFSLLLLKDKRVASCSRDKTIRIFNPSNDYHCSQVLNRYSDDIISICELSDGTIVSCSNDKSIIIGDYTIENAHDSAISKVISLPNNRIASCSWDSTIRVWKSNPPYSNTPIKVLTGHSRHVTSIVYIKEKNVLISGSSDKVLRLWNMTTYQCETMLENVQCCWFNAMCQIDKDRVIVGGFNICSIVNIDKCIIEKKIKDYSLIGVRCFIKLRDNNTILIGCSHGEFFFYDMKTKHYNITKNNHNNMNDLLVIDDNTFLSSSGDNTIKVWKY